MCASDWSRRVAKCRVGIEAVAPQELHSAAMKVTGAWGADSSMDAASGSRVDRPWPGRVAAQVARGRMGGRAKMKYEMS